MKDGRKKGRKMGIIAVMVIFSIGFSTACPLPFSPSIEYGIKILPEELSVGDVVEITPVLTSLRVEDIELFREVGLCYGWDLRIFFNNLLDLELIWLRADNPAVLRFEGNKAIAVGGGETAVTAGIAVKSDVLEAENITIVQNVKVAGEPYLDKPESRIEMLQWWGEVKTTPGNWFFSSGNKLYTANVIEVSRENEIVIKIWLTDWANNALSDEEIIVEAKGKEYAVKTDDDGIAELTFLTDEFAGPLKVSFHGNDLYAGCSKEAEYYVAKQTHEMELKAAVIGNTVKIDLSAPGLEHETIDFYALAGNEYLFLFSAQVSDGAINRTIRYHGDETKIKAYYKGNEVYMPVEAAAKITARG